MSIRYWYFFLIFHVFKGTFLSKGTECFFVITPNKRTFFFPETENLNFGETEKCLENEDVLKFKSLEPFKAKKAAFGWLRHS